MKYAIIMLLILSMSTVFHLNAAVNGTNTLMPVPAQAEAKNGKCRIDKTFKIKAEGTRSLRLDKAISRMVVRIAGRTGLFMPQAFFDRDETVKNPNMIISIKRKGKVILGEDESYMLDISADKVLLDAETDIGAIRGMETFLQLLDSDEKGYFFPAVSIKDKPRFKWRGLLIDVGRHFIPANVIKRNLDGMAAAKMNVLHWHLTEDQGFRIECKTFPKLHELGSDGQYYTQEEVKSIIQYAADRGIRVMPEFDLPGHSTSWLPGFPELASAPGPYKVDREWGIKDPTFNPTIEKTYEFLDAFFKEMSALFPDDYIHIGGDENNGRQWDANEQIQKFMKDKGIKNNHELQSYFNNRMLKIFSKYGKKMVGWDEILQPDMPKDIVIHSWRGRESMKKAANEGYQTILSSGYYIDLMHSAEYHYLNDPISDEMDLSEQAKKMILGGEATMWGESVNYETIDSRTWPRTAAIAERLWSPSSVRDVDDMYRRLKVFSYHLEELGLTHKKNVPYFLRRLTNNAPIRELRNLVDIIEPIKDLRRGEIILQYTYTPMTRVVDVAVADADVARNFRKMVKAYLKDGAKDKALEEKITYWLNLWKDNHKKLLPVIKASPILWEIETLSQDASNCGKIGLEAMDMIKNGKKAPQNWSIDGWSKLYKAEVPRGDTELMIISAVKELVLYVSPDFFKKKGDNKLSPVEKAEGWKLLFDGKTMNKWHVRGKNKLSETWEIADGVIHCLGSKKGESGAGDDLLTGKEYSFFELSLDWKVSEGGNSGIFYLCREEEGEALYKTNFQMQIIDNNGGRDAQKGEEGNWLAGSLWGLVAAEYQNAKPAETWNSITILVRGNGQKIHKQNGKNVVEYYAGELWYAPHWEKIVAESSFKNVGHIIDPKGSGGSIGLQDHGSEVWFKNIKIREIDMLR